MRDRLTWRSLRRSGSRRVAASTGLLLGLLPALVGAAEEQGRQLERPEDFWKVALFTGLGAGSILLLAGLGRMYQRQRGIRWRFQDPDSPAQDGHASH